jgi:hypothetical protein
MEGRRVTNYKERTEDEGRMEVREGRKGDEGRKDNEGRKEKRTRERGHQ